MMLVQECLLSHRPFLGKSRIRHGTPKLINLETPLVSFARFCDTVWEGGIYTLFCGRAQLVCSLGVNRSGSEAMGLFMDRAIALSMP